MRLALGGMTASAPSDSIQYNQIITVISLVRHNGPECLLPSNQISCYSYIMQPVQR